MLAELLAQSGHKILRNVAPDGREYWAARFWDRASAEEHPVLRKSFLDQKDAIAGYLSKYAAGITTSLEVACGTGEFTKLTADLTGVKEMTAIDISSQGLARTQQRVDHDNLKLVHGDFWKENGLPKADLVMCVDAIHHLGDIKEVLTRLRSFVKPGGLFIGNFWTADNFHEFERKRYGRAEHLRRTLAFFGTAALIRVSAGKLKTGAYRTQLRRSADSMTALRTLYSEVLAVDEHRYFTSFAARL
ncbi:class I SAM-dependent methyltransferase [Kibdelosporangium phytohabitans]|uniref:Methyltransferase type 12 n=1 Tax=Kibdelosporangium phytohabitans TaxID=860235 RepID=A0A0N9I8U2_9PSEU|nr:class I SAM-dependent methyltransferase [Kibdelosporangium phytohabitans]ALG10928.1 methyltransferase type 12 [Kibdelosporangium phytohabitans]MBE1462121.1 SAM-dependent methyltransferase [Kibdelosporangium phytohabitans]